MTYLKVGPLGLLLVESDYLPLSRSPGGSVRYVLGYHSKKGNGEWKKVKDSYELPLSEPPGGSVRYNIPGPLMAHSE